MVNKKTNAVALLVVGILILGLSLLADSFGIGGSNTTFGPRQIAGTVVGIVVIVAGLAVRRWA